MIHVSLFNHRQLAAKDPQKLNNLISNCLKNLNIVSYFSSSLNTCECLICQIY